MRKLSAYLQPLLWMLLGPPAFRITTSRNALSSVEGDQDIWNIIRIVWWLVWGTVAFISLIRMRPELGRRWSYLGHIPMWICLWLGSIFLSTIFSPSVPYTLANGVMMLMLVFGALDLTMKIALRRIDVDSILKAVLYVSVGMLSLVGILWITNPGMVGGSGWTFSGLRIRGEGIAYTPITAQAVLFLGLYFAYKGQGKSRLFMLALSMYGLYWINLSQTRSAYITVIVASFVLCWHWLDLKKRTLNIVALASVMMIGICIMLFAYDTVHGVRWRLDNMYDKYVLRDEYAIEDQAAAKESLASLNGRTDAQAVLFDQALKRPLGMGYIAGTRTFMASAVEDLPSEAFHGAHNAYLETMSGAGFGALFGLLLLIGATLLRGVRVRDPSSVVVRALFYVVLLEGLVESELAFPFHQSPVYFWIWISCLLGLYIKQMSEPRLPLPSAEMPQSRRPVQRPYPVAG